MTLSEKIAALRRRAGLSQEQLGERLGVSRQAVSRWEAGGAAPELDKIVQLSRLFGVTTDALLLEEVDALLPAPRESADRAENARRPGAKDAAVRGRAVGLALLAGGLLAAALGWHAYRSPAAVWLGLALQLAGCALYEALALPDAAQRRRFYAAGVWLLTPVPCAFLAHVLIALVCLRYSVSAIARPLLAAPLWACVSLVAAHELRARA